MEPGATDLWAYRGVWGIAIRGVQARLVVSRLVRLRAIKKGPESGRLISVSDKMFQWSLGV